MERASRLAFAIVLACCADTHAQRGQRVMRQRMGSTIISKITFSNNAAPVVNAGPDGSATMPALYQLAGACTDDGLPSNNLTCTWSKTSGPGTVSFSNVHSDVSTAGVDTAGTYVLTYTGNDTALSTSDSVTVVFAAASTWPGSFTCPNPSSGTHNYFVCACGSGAESGCTAGNDANAGTSSGAAWATMAKFYSAVNASGVSFTAGDTISLCKGGVFVNSGGQNTNIFNTGCSGSNPCVMRSYTAGWGGSGKPEIRCPTGQTCLNFQDTGNADHDEGWTVLDLHLTGAGDQTQDGVNFFNDIDKVTMCGLVLEQFDVAMNIHGSNAANPGSDGINSDIKLYNSVVHDISRQGFLGEGPNMTLDYNSWTNCGFAAAGGNHTIYISGSQGETSFFTGQQVIGNYITQSAYVSTGCPGSTPCCGGVEIVHHGSSDGLQIQNNEIFEAVGHTMTGCWGIAVDSGYDSSPSPAVAEEFKNLLVAGNKIHNVGNVMIGISACSTGCVVENNQLFQSQTINGTAAILCDDGQTGAGHAAVNSGIAVRNDSIYYANTASVNETAITLRTSGTGYISANNSVQYAGTQASFNCFSYPLTASAYTAIKANACKYGAGEWEDGTGNLATWQATTGSPDVGSIEGSDPLYNNVVSDPPDLCTQSGSPLRNAGNNTYKSTLDPFNNITRDSSPDIGACDH